jgi:sugar phosphate isomerase/epimerase
MKPAVDGIYFGWGKGLSAEDLVRLVVESGAEAVNWPLAEGYADAADPDSWQRCASLLRDEGLTVSSIGATSQNSAIAGEEGAFRAEIEQAVKAAEILGTRVIDCWPRMAEGATKADSQAVLAHNIRAVAEMVGDAGLVISFEPEPDVTIERYEETLEFLEPLPTVARITADTYHIQRAGDDLVAAAKAMGPRLGILHISGSHRGEPGSEGDECDHEGFVRAAREVGYDGDLVLQYSPPADTLDSLKRAVELCKEIVARTG